AAASARAAAAPPPPTARRSGPRGTAAGETSAHPCRRTVQDHADTPPPIKISNTLSDSDRPAYQWMKISVTSTTSKLLLAIGSLTRHPDEGKLFLIARTTTRRRARRPHGEFRERQGGELRERQTATAGNSVSADTVRCRST